MTGHYAHSEHKRTVYQMKTQTHINKSEPCKMLLIQETAQRFLMDTNTCIYNRKINDSFQNHTRRLQIDTKIF